MLLVVMIIALTLSSEEYLVTDKISVIAQRPPPPRLEKGNNLRSTKILVYLVCRLWLGF